MGSNQEAATGAISLSQKKIYCWTFAFSCGVFPSNGYEEEDAATMTVQNKKEGNINLLLLKYQY